jgi:hypothetical protein
MEKLPLYKVGDNVKCYSFEEKIVLLNCIVERVLLLDNTDQTFYELKVLDSFKYPIIYRAETELL